MTLQLYSNSSGPLKRFFSKDILIAYFIKCLKKIWKNFSYKFFTLLINLNLFSFIGMFRRTRGSKTISRPVQGVYKIESLKRSFPRSTRIFGLQRGHSRPWTTSASSTSTSPEALKGRKHLIASRRTLQRFLEDRVLNLARIFNFETPSCVSHSRFCDFDFLYEFAARNWRFLCHDFGVGWFWLLGLNWCQFRDWFAESRGWKILLIIWICSYNGFAFIVIWIKFMIP